MLIDISLFIFLLGNEYFFIICVINFKFFFINMFLVFLFFFLSFFKYICFLFLLRGKGNVLLFVIYFVKKNELYIRFIKLFNINIFFFYNSV